MTILYLDTETRSDINLFNHGVHRYSQSDKFNVILLSWAIDDEPVHVWDISYDGYKAIPKRLAKALKDPSVKVVMHNSGFDRVVMAARGIAELPVSRITDTMVMALAHGLPASLEMLGKALGLPEEMLKMEEGKRLINLFCKPRRDGAFNTYMSHKEDWDLFKTYALMDIVAMRECYKRMPKANYPQMEHHLWQLDQKIHDRGIPVDVEFAEAAVRESEVERDRLNVLTIEATEGMVERTTQRDRLIKYLQEEHGVKVPDLQSATLERRLADPDLTPEVRALIENRLQASQNAASKYKTIISHNVDGRLKNTLQMYGASRTGRDAGRVFQPQNLKRPTMWRGLDGAELDAAIEEDVRAIKGGIVTFVHPGEVMEVLGSCVRSVIAAPEGKKLVQADLSNIEGRGLVWLADEGWKVKYFHDFDAGRVQFDNYVMAYARAMNVEPDTVDRYQRDIGKVMELGLGYGGGVAAFLTFADVYALDLTELAEAVHQTADHTMAECVAKYDWAVENGYHADLPQFEYAACEYLKTKWREAHPKTVAFWGDLERAFRMATEIPNKTFRVGKLEFRRHGGWLTIRLPSGRRLVYANPRMAEDGQLSFMGVDGYTKKWQRIKTYGGKLCIVKGTPVLTKRGWVPIEEVSRSDRVWDGDAYVDCEGAIHNGESEVIEAYGAWMTADHEVLTDEGWKTASQSSGYNRAKSRLPDGVEIPRVRWEKITVGSQMRLRFDGGNPGDRAAETKESRDYSVVRMHEGEDHREAAHYAWDDESSGVCRMEKHDRQVPSSNPPVVEELRGEGDYGLPGMAGVFRGVLGGHGGGVQTGADLGQDRQRQGVLQGQLQVDDPQSASEQQKVFASVFDVLNCGPRNRYMIATPSGPLIVHNCENVTSATARDILIHRMPDIEKAGYKIIMRVHDEFVTETPDTDEYSSDELARLMASPHEWTQGLPLAAAGFEAKRYRKD